MREAAEGGLYTADDHRHVREQLFEDLGIHRYGVVRTGAGLAVGSIGIVVPQALGGGVMVHHGIHGAAV